MKNVLPKKINLGCGLNISSNWINLDASWNARLAKHQFLRKALKYFHLLPKRLAEIDWPQNIFIHDVRKKFLFENNCFSAVYSSHLLEHLYLEEAKELLAECFRILEPGGVLRIVVPDFKTIIKEYDNLEKSNFSNAADIISKKIFIWESKPYHKNPIYKIYDAVNDFHSHKWMYDAESLIEYFKTAGFESAKEMKFLESRISDIEEVESASRVLNGEGICIEGIKPKIL
ncbi:methyltransferase domain-containing protein [Candidatus Wolfebacteria bacterium]|nr:methyltransferase domain-containing protein [Candidatus Wolfebacteria bacterium]